jgi:ABC-2 type transport system ATP-binding protein
VSAIVSAANATKHYGEVLGLNGFTADFGPGITALIGPNGSGKSTLFRILVGQLRLDGGSIAVLGRSPYRDASLRGEIGYCPEHTTLYGWMSALDFVGYLLRVQGFSPAEAERRAMRALTEVGLHDSVHRRIRGFSKGMRQRAKIAQALAHDPKLLLLDEPLNGLDPIGRVALLELFTRLAASGRHLIVSSHILYEVERLTQQVVMISNGRAIAQGDVHAIREALDAHPHTIALSAPDPRRLAERLARWEHVSAIEFAGPHKLVVRTRAPDRFYGDLPALVVDEKLAVTALESPDDNLEAVFRFLAEER